MDKSTISMAMFNSFLYVYQAGYGLWMFMKLMTVDGIDQLMTNLWL